MLHAKPAIQLTDCKMGTVCDLSLRVITVSDPAGLKVTGAVDLTARDEWRQALQVVTENAADIHLDVSELRFIDCGGVSELVHASRRLPAGRQVVVHGQSPAFHRVLQLCWPNVPTIKVVAA
jgi:anti-anti-sigma factor